eukprot:8395284-Prorocentrum_lima.AAC.1
MCIRDSSCRTSIGASGGREAANAGTLPQPCCARTPWSFRARAALPVSYTHLTLPTICSV